MIYLDNAATTNYKPPEVIEAVEDALKNYSANPGRSGHKLSIAALRQVAGARQKIKELVNAPEPENVVFTQNCTAALNLAILGRVKRGCHVITSMAEHNSVLRPLYELQRQNIISVTVLKPDGAHKVPPEEVKKALRKDTAMIALSHISNVTGAENDVGAIGAIAKENNVCFVLDCAQSLGYADVDMQKNHVSMLAFPGHKGLHGIMGIGGLCFREEFKPKPVYFGGTGTDSHLLRQPDQSPEAFESGTVNVPGIMALSAAIDHHNRTKQWQDWIRQKLTDYIFMQLKETENLTLVSAEPGKSGIISFKVAGADSFTVCDALDTDYDIACRGGLHCAPLIHEHLGTKTAGLVRASVSAWNTLEEAEIFVKAVAAVAFRAANNTPHA